jgi:hypothetical protein
VHLVGTYGEKAWIRVSQGLATRNVATDISKFKGSTFRNQRIRLRTKKSLHLMNCRTWLKSSSSKFRL